MIRSTILTLGLLIIISSLLFTGYAIHAQNPLIFGGLVTFSYYCTCSFNYLITVSPPTAAQLVWYPMTPQFANFQLPRMGVWTLGNYSPGGVCLVYAGKSCVPVGAPIGTIGPIVGTSF